MFGKKSQYKLISWIGNKTFNLFTTWVEKRGQDCKKFGYKFSLVSQKAVMVELTYSYSFVIATCENKYKNCVFKQKYKFLAN